MYIKRICLLIFFRYWKVFILTDLEIVQHLYNVFDCNFPTIIIQVYNYFFVKRVHRRNFKTWK